MPIATAERNAVVVGIVTAGIGAALLAAPARVGALVGLVQPMGTRVVGVVDLAIAAGLIRSRVRSPWLAARAVANVATAAYALRLARGRGMRAALPAYIFSGVLAVATTVDTATTATLVRGHR